MKYLPCDKHESPMNGYNCPDCINERYGVLPEGYLARMHRAISDAIDEIGKRAPSLNGCRIYGRERESCESVVRDLK